MREGLFVVTDLELGGPLVLKKMMDIVIDVYDSNLCSLNESLQVLCLKDVSDKVLEQQ